MKIWIFPKIVIPNYEPFMFFSQNPIIKKLLQKSLKVWRYSIIKVDSFEISKADSVVVEKSDCRNLNNFWNLVEIMYKNFISVWVFRKGRLTDNHQKDNNLIFST